MLDWFVTRQYLPRISLMLGGAAVALAVGLLVFQILTNIQERYQAMLDRLRRIAELNHHIRNALQVIAYHNIPERTERTIQQVNAEVVRIESVLRDVSAALGEHAEFPDAVVPSERRNR
jgi:predicted PurR-regulated permease PerM